MTHKHKLAALGDSLTMGFCSGAIYHTERSYPVMLARALGCADTFRVPCFDHDHGATGGIPFNLETLLHALEKRWGKGFAPWQFFLVLADINHQLDKVEKFWERSHLGPELPCHNMSILSYTVQDTYQLTQEWCAAALPQPKNDHLLLRQIPQLPMYRAALRTLCSNHHPWSQLDHIEAVANDGGIENLIVALGANNCLGAIIEMQIKHSCEADLYNPPHQRHCNLWLPEHFATALGKLAQRLSKMSIGNIFVTTVPRVTIPPISRGFGSKEGEYYDYYTRPWIWDDAFDPARHPFLRRAEARHIDAIVDGYNATIRALAERYGWHLVDLATMFDTLAWRRNNGAPTYQWPPAAVEALRKNPATAALVQGDTVKLDTRYMWLEDKPQTPGNSWLRAGGLFSLDGVHPTTICYGLIADMVLEAMKQAGVKRCDGSSPALEWEWIVAQDSLLNNPPRLLKDLRALLDTLSARRYGQIFFQLLESFKSNV